MNVSDINTTKLLLYFTLFGISLVLIFTFIIIIINGFSFSIKSITTLLGIIISCASLIITAYFVIMAINAYGHIENIEKIENTIVDKYKKIEAQNNDSTKLLYTYAEEKKDKDLSRLIKLHEWRIAYLNPSSYDEDTRISYFLNLANKGEVSDIEPIEKIAKNKKESKRIRETANSVVKKLKERFSEV